jgi:hypothetical protein
MLGLLAEEFHFSCGFLLFILGLQIIKILGVSGFLLLK